jgi:hypothetical protein
MTRPRLALLTALLPALLLGLAAPASADDSGVAKIYSPFAVELGGPGAFRVITFEDVGMHLPEPSEAALLYETVSEAVAGEIASSAQLGYEVRPVYEPLLTDPREHVYCDQRHLYVALWRGFEPHRWGFSLWSGCGADDQFAWQEVEAPWDETLPLPALVEPLARALVEALARAEQAECFQLRC